MPSWWRLVLLVLLVSLRPELALALDPTKPITQYIYESWQTDQGLPQNSAQAIVQTRDGYLWLGTQEGLARFDGVKFTVFDTSTTPEIHNNSIEALLEDREGSLWIGTFGGGLLRLKDGVFSSYTVKEGLANDRVHALAQASDGSLWIGTAGGLSRLRDGHFATFDTKDGLATSSVRALLGSPDGSLWIGTQTGGLQRMSGGKFLSYTTKAGLASDHVRALLHDRAGALWIGTVGGLTRLKDRSFATYGAANGLSQAAVSSLFEDRQGNLWVGTNGGGLNRLTAGQFTAFGLPHGLSTGSILALAEDREGSLWVGTAELGLSRLRDGKFATYTTTEGLPSDVVYPILQDRSGSIWAGTAGSGIAVLRQGDTRFVPDSSPGVAAPAVIQALYEDRSGDLWAGTRTGLQRRHGGRWSAWRTPEVLASVSVRAILEDSQGDLWIGTDRGLHRLRGNSSQFYTTRDGLGNNRVLVLFEDRQKALWVGTGGGGLSALRNGVFRTYTEADGLATGYITTLHQDREGTLWIGTEGGGLSRLTSSPNTPGRIESFAARDGLFSDTVHQILEDDRGYLWMSSNKGIFRVAKRDIEDYSRGNLKAIPSVSYGKADGMKSAECNGGNQPSGIRTSGGQLWFPTIKGLAVIDPAHLRGNEVLPPVEIEGIVADNRAVPMAGAATAPLSSLAAGTRNLEFHYTGLSFVSPAAVRFRYQLDGFDRQWVEAGTRRVAYYTNLPAGNYRFHVSACNNDGLWNEAGTAFSFSIAPHFYQTGWFYALVALAGAAALWSIYRLRVRRIHAAHAAILSERGRMAREIHDTFSQGFTSLLLRLSAAEDVLVSAPTEAQTHLQEARQLGLASLVEVRRSVMALRPQALEAGDLPAALSSLARQTASVTGASVRFTVQGPARDLPPEAQVNLLRLAQEALTNAVRHGHAQEMAVELTFSPQRLVLRITDDGLGFDSAAPQVEGAEGGGFGLTGMRERAALLSGRISWRSRPGEGTEVVVDAPL